MRRRVHYKRMKDWFWFYVIEGIMAASKYHGLCETCDHDVTCTLKRSTRLEIIHCEQFSTQPVMNKQTPIQEKASPSTALQSHGAETIGA
jgi:hypothetical protein